MYIGAEQFTRIYKDRICIGNKEKAKQTEENSDKQIHKRTERKIEIVSES